jgi:hypothetical protein
LIPNYAAINGDLEMLKWCHDNGCVINSFAAENAARYGHLQILKYLIENNCEWNRYDILLEATKGGHIGILNYIMKLDQPVLHANTYHCYLCLDTEHTECCVANTTVNDEHLETIRWAYENTYCGYFMERYDLCAVAAENGHLHTLKWLIRNGYVWNENTCIEAAKSGHLHILRWAIYNGCTCNLGKCKIAAKEYPHILRWLKRKNTRILFRSYIGTF